jgi:hypothetical protein
VRKKGTNKAINKGRLRGKTKPGNKKVNREARTKQGKEFMKIGRQQKLMQKIKYDMKKGRKVGGHEEDSSQTATTRA